jgi:hypothetical protein
MESWAAVSTLKLEKRPIGILGMSNPDQMGEQYGTDTHLPIGYKQNELDYRHGPVVEIGLPGQEAVDRSENVLEQILA